MQTSPTIEPPPPLAKRRGRAGGYALIAIAALCVTIAELLLKKGATSAGGTSVFGVEALGSGWTWLGILSHLAGFAAWLAILRRMPLSLAFSLMSVTQILVPLAACVLLGEQLHVHRVAGVVLVLAGIATIARSFARAEESL